MEYHKIETLYERGDNFKVKPGVLKNPVYGIIKTWQFTEKIDGTNMRATWKDGKLSFGGRTDNANVPGDLIKWMQEHVSTETMNTLFSGSNAVIYGEGYGAGIQKGGGDYSAEKKFIVFDVLVGDKWWLNWENTCDVATKLGLDVVPYFGEMTLEEATEMVKQGFKSKLNGGIKDAEGLVGRPCEALFDKKGSRLIVKLKTKDF
jgi:ATP-dependent RNA circularization protein (DNA/RNA ligase family)